MRDERASTLAQARLLPREPLTHLPPDYDPGVDPSPAARRKRAEGDTSRDRGAAAFAVRNSHDLIPVGISVRSDFASLGECHGSLTPAAAPLDRDQRAEAEERGEYQVIAR